MQAAQYPPPVAEAYLPTRRANPILFLYPVLDSLNTGGFIRKSVAIAIQFAGGFFLLAGLIACFGVLSISLKAERGAFGGFLFSVILLAGLAAVGQVFWYRAAAIRSIDNSSGFVIMPIVSHLFRLSGEVYACLAVCIGIGGCLAIWLSGASPMGMLGGFGPTLPMMGGGGMGMMDGRGEGGFMSGLWLAAMGCLGGFGALVFFYFLAELSIVTASIARDMRALAAKVGA